MRYTIELREGYLRGELVERETAEETREFGDALHAAMVENGLSRMLVVVRSSRAIFRVEEYQLSEFLRRLPGARVALVADAPGLAAAHEYVQLIASQKGVALRSFTSEKPALEWLLHE
jgi:hypothetical protein